MGVLWAKGYLRLFLLARGVAELCRGLPGGKSLSFVGNRCISFRFDGREACFAKPPSHCQKKVTKEKATR
jgi:hypothetical protein